MDRLLLETDAPDGLPRLSGAEAAELVPVPEPRSADGSRSEQHAGGAAFSRRSGVAHARHQGGRQPGDGGEAAYAAAGEHRSGEHPEDELARLEAGRRSGQGNGAGCGVAAGERGGAESRGPASSAGGHGADRKLRTGGPARGHDGGAHRPPLNHPANIRCLAEGQAGWLLLLHRLQQFHRTNAFPCETFQGTSPPLISLTALQSSKEYRSVSSNCLSCNVDKPMSRLLLHLPKEAFTLPGVRRVVLRHIANLMGRSEREVAEAAYRNAERLFHTVRARQQLAARHNSAGHK